LNTGNANTGIGNSGDLNTGLFIAGDSNNGVLWRGDHQGLSGVNIGLTVSAPGGGEVPITVTGDIPVDIPVNVTVTPIEIPQITIPAVQVGQGGLLSVVEFGFGPGTTGCYSLGCTLTQVGISITAGSNGTLPGASTGIVVNPITIGFLDSGNTALTGTIGGAGTGISIDLAAGLGPVRIPLLDIPAAPGFFNSTQQESSGLLNSGAGGGSGFFNAGTGFSGLWNVALQALAGSGVSGMSNYGSRASGLSNLGSALSGWFNTSTLPVAEPAWVSGLANVGSSVAGIFHGQPLNLGLGNLGSLNLGSGNLGDGNIGYGNSGNNNVGLGNTGDGNLGFGNTGTGNIGIGLTGDNLIGFGGWNSGTGNTGLFNSGTGNTGLFNSGSNNNGVLNSGADNFGIGNAGDLNTGMFNTGNTNTGGFNSGNTNTGWLNYGNTNTGLLNGGEESNGLLWRGDMQGLLGFSYSLTIPEIPWNYSLDIAIDIPIHAASETLRTSSVTYSIPFNVRTWARQGACAFTFCTWSGWGAPTYIVGPEDLGDTIDPITILDPMDFNYPLQDDIQMSDSGTIGPIPVIDFSWQQSPGWFNSTAEASSGFFNSGAGGESGIANVGANNSGIGNAGVDLSGFFNNDMMVSP
jgi:PPE-repeat protein